VDLFLETGLALGGHGRHHSVLATYWVCIGLLQDLVVPVVELLWCLL
jgi:hypothetical protein